MTKMKIIIAVFICFLLSIISAIDLNSSNLESKILNGNPVEHGQFKSLVSVRVSKKFRCAGCIIDELKVLTAAHCIDNLFKEYGDAGISIITVNIGSLNRRIGGTTNLVRNVYIHPDYKAKSVGSPYDFAVMILYDEVTESEYIKFAVLPEENAPVIAGKTGIVVGWGSKQAGVIQSMSLTLEYLELTVAPENFCKENLKELSVDIQFCTLVGNKTNVDRGDCGDPLFIDGVVMGINAFGSAEVPATFNKVSSLIPYIKQAVKGPIGKVLFKRIESSYKKCETNL